MSIGLHNLKPAPGSRHRRKIIGRGEGSGHGGSSTRGRKGQTARTGEGKMTGFEGGQMPLYRRIPKRGFTNSNRVEFEVVNVQEIGDNFEAGSVVTRAELTAKGLVRRSAPVKILGDGAIAKAITVKAQAFSGSAKEKITKAGGAVEVVK